MCVEPLVVLEQGEKGQGDLTVLVSLRAGWKQTGVAQDVAPMLYIWLCYRADGLAVAPLTQPFEKVSGQYCLHAKNF